MKLSWPNFSHEHNIILVYLFWDIGLNAYGHKEYFNWTQIFHCFILYDIPIYNYFLKTNMFFNKNLSRSKLGLQYLLTFVTDIFSHSFGPFLVIAFFTQGPIKEKPYIIHVHVILKFTLINKINETFNSYKKYQHYTAFSTKKNSLDRQLSNWT